MDLDEKGKRKIGGCKIGNWDWPYAPIFYFRQRDEREGEPEGVRRCFGLSGQWSRERKWLRRRLAATTLASGVLPLRPSLLATLPIRLSFQRAPPAETTTTTTITTTIAHVFRIPPSLFRNRAWTRNKRKVRFLSLPSSQFLVLPSPPRRLFRPLLSRTFYPLRSQRTISQLP